MSVDREHVQFAAVGLCVGVTLGALGAWLATSGSRTCKLDDQQLARLRPPAAPLPAAMPEPAMPAPVAAVPEPAPPPAIAEPPPLTFRVDVTRVIRHGEVAENPGFALRAEVTLTRLRENPNPVDLRAKTTCTAGAATFVENGGFGAPGGTILVGESAVGAFIDPFYWTRLSVTPTRCDLRFFVDGVDAGRACATIGEPITFVAEPCPVEVEAPLPQPPT